LHYETVLQTNNTLTQTTRNNFASQNKNSAIGSNATQWSYQDVRDEHHLNHQRMILQMSNILWRCQMQQRTGNTCDNHETMDLKMRDGQAFSSSSSAACLTHP
jgi:hypothetical protein